MTKIITKLKVDDVLHDLSKENNKILDQIIENFNEFSIVLKNSKINNDFEENSDIFKTNLNKLNKFYKTYRLNDKYIQNSIKTLINSFENKILNNENNLEDNQQNRDSNSSNYSFIFHL